MAEIDVSDVLLDPDIAGEAFVVVRRLERVNSFGERTNFDHRQLVVGSVTPTGENSLVREEAYQAQTRTIRVITAYLLRGPSSYGLDGAGNRINYDPDIILWRGDYYVVKSTSDYSRFGGGMIEAECSSIDYVERPPMNP